MDPSSILNKFLRKVKNSCAETTSMLNGKVLLSLLVTQAAGTSYTFDCLNHTNYAQHDGYNTCIQLPPGLRT